jgi:hypothetical protein
VVFDQRTFTVRQLDAALERVAAGLDAVLPDRTADGAVPFSGRVDVRTGNVVVTVDPSLTAYRAAVDTALAADVASGIVDLRWAAIGYDVDENCPSRETCTPVRGGLRDDLPTVGQPAGDCTTGFVMRAPNGVRALSTAGHCGDNLHRVSGAVVGATVPGTLINGGNTDAQIVSLNQINTQPVPGNSVFRNANSDTPITTKVTNPAAVMTYSILVCTESKAGNRCGIYMTHNETWSGSQTGYGTTSASTCGGDSGAPVVENSDSRAFGLHKGSRRATDLDPCGYLSFFTWITNVEANTGFTLLTTPTTNSLGGGQTLYPNQSLRSPDGRFTAIMQGDGNFVVYGPSGAIFATGTGYAGTVATMQGDGNFVLYRPGTIPVWATGTSGHANSIITIQNDGNLVVYAPGTIAVWDSF